jgi:hypothetical protein
MSDVTDHNGVRPGDAEQLHDEPVVVEDPFLEQRQQQLKVAVGAGAGAALVAYLLWRLKVRRTPPTPTERLSDAARSLGDASAAFGGRAAHRVSATVGDKAVPAGRSAGKAATKVARKAARSAADTTTDTALPAARKAAGRTAEAAVPAGERLLEATKHLGGASVAAGERAFDKITDTAGPVAGNVADTAGDVAAKAVDVGQAVGSGIAAVPEAVADAAHGVHKFWRKWTLRILWVLAAGIGYTAGAAAGRERYEQIVGAAKGVAGRPEVQQAQAKAQQKMKESLSSDPGSTPSTTG